VVYSGGLDSTVLLTKCKRNFADVIALNFSYGSKHNRKERISAISICTELEVPLYCYDLPEGCIKADKDSGWCHEDFLKSDLLRSGGEIPEGDYDKENMKSTVVPFRNGMMLALAAGFAESRGFNIITIANHGGDHFLYPDCRPDFIASYQVAVQEGTDGQVCLVAPFVDISKEEIVALGAIYKAPFHLTWSCYRSELQSHCGRCGTCRERIEAFKNNGLIDPVEYDIDVDWTGCRSIS